MEQKFQEEEKMEVVLDVETELLNNLSQFYACPCECLEQSAQTSCEFCKPYGDFCLCNNHNNGVFGDCKFCLFEMTKSLQSFYKMEKQELKTKEESSSTKELHANCEIKKAKRIVERGFEVVVSEKSKENTTQQQQLLKESEEEDENMSSDMEVLNHLSHFYALDCYCLTDLGKITCENSTSDLSSENHHCQICSFGKCISHNFNSEKAEKAEKKKEPFERSEYFEESTSTSKNVTTTHLEDEDEAASFAKNISSDKCICQECTLAAKREKKVKKQDKIFEDRLIKKELESQKKKNDLDDAHMEVLKSNSTSKNATSTTHLEDEDEAASFAKNTTAKAVVVLCTAKAPTDIDKCICQGCTLAAKIYKKINKDFLDDAHMEVLNNLSEFYAIGCHCLEIQTQYKTEAYCGTCQPFGVSCCHENEDDNEEICKICMFSECKYFDLEKKNEVEEMDMTSVDMDKNIVLKKKQDKIFEDQIQQTKRKKKELESKKKKNDLDDAQFAKFVCFLSANTLTLKKKIKWKK